MYTVVLATGNKGKVREMHEILKDLNMEVRSMGELGIHLDVEENGTTYEANARIKATALREHLEKLATAGATVEGVDVDRDTSDTAALPQIDLAQTIVLADDSGLAVDALNGEPGVYSARYAGPGATGPEQCAYLIEKMKDIPAGERQAVFTCVIVAILPDGSERVCAGEMPGEITEAMHGTNGFGYDPIYFLPEYGQTAAEISEELKNTISHRARALAKLSEELKSL